MAESDASVLEPKVETSSVRRAQTKRKASNQEHDQKSPPKRQPRYHVVLWDDSDHTYDYVITMMKELFGHPLERGFVLAHQVDTQGRAICLTTTKEHAELKRDQIHSYGRDPRMQKSAGSMSASIEPES